MAGVRNSQSLAKGRRLHWLHWLAHSSSSCRISGERRFDPRRPPAADRRQALPGNPLCQRLRPTGGPPQCGGSVVIAEISVITAIALTAVIVDIVAPAGRGWYERAARRRNACGRCLFVDDEPGRIRPWLLLRRRRLVGNYCKQQEKEIVRIIQIIQMMKIMI